jgi:hypothetical protein
MLAQVSAELGRPRHQPVAFDDLEGGRAAAHETARR